MRNCSIRFRFTHFPFFKQGTGSVKDAQNGARKLFPRNAASQSGADTREKYRWLIGSTSTICCCCCWEVLNICSFVAPGNSCWDIKNTDGKDAQSNQNQIMPNIMTNALTYGSPGMVGSCAFPHRKKRVSKTTMNVRARARARVCVCVRFHGYLLHT